MIRRILFLLAAVVLGALALGRAGAQGKEKVVIGSKAFPESWILGDALALLVRDAGGEAEHKSNMGGTEIVYKALQGGGVDVYPEYTGTVSEVLMKATGRPTLDQIREFLRGQGIGMTDSLGFNDGYALAVTAATQQKYGLQRISDLGKHPELRLAFTHEFVGRKDGWQGLAAHYGLAMPSVRGIQHELAYQAIERGEIDVTEIYTTDAQIQRLGLKMLEDDRAFFPRYDAVLLYRLDLPQRAPKAFGALQKLVGKIDEARMIRANARVSLEKQSAPAAAKAMLGELGSADLSAAANAAPAEHSGMWAEIARNTLQHLELVAISLLAAILVGVPLGVLAARSRFFSVVALSGTGILQTIPSLALLAFLISVPGLGIRKETAVVALVVYSLLPIVRNTYVGLTTIPPSLTESADALGMPPLAQLFRVRLPLASPSIMAGIKTSAVINVGTATLAALIGAGGLGEPILRGISLVDSQLILQGAVPAALLALLVQGGFDLLDRLVIPRGLRLPPASSD